MFDKSKNTLSFCNGFTLNVTDVETNKFQWEERHRNKIRLQDYKIFFYYLIKYSRLFFFLNKINRAYLTVFKKLIMRMLLKLINLFVPSVDEKWKKDWYEASGTEGNSGRWSFSRHAERKKAIPVPPPLSLSLAVQFYFFSTTNLIAVLLTEADVPYRSRLYAHAPIWQMPE